MRRARYYHRIGSQLQVGISHGLFGTAKVVLISRRRLTPRLSRSSLAGYRDFDGQGLRHRSRRHVTSFFSPQCDTRADVERVAQFETQYLRRCDRRWGPRIRLPSRRASRRFEFLALHVLGDSCRTAQFRVRARDLAAWSNAHSLSAAVWFVCARATIMQVHRHDARHADRTWLPRSTVRSPLIPTVPWLPRSMVANLLKMVQSTVAARVGCSLGPAALATQVLDGPRLSANSC